MNPVIPIPAFVHDDLQALGMEIPGVLLNQLAAYLHLLLEVNKKFNLTSIRDPDEAWRRHIIDSLTVLPGLDDLEEESQVIDIGSGGGLPGIPVAICRPDVKVTLLESTGKKADFLRQCVEELSLANVAVVNDRAENLGQNKVHRQQYDAAICRAVGPMNILVELTLPFVKVGGRVLAMKGPSVETELTGAGDALETLGAGDISVVDAYPESFNQSTVIVMVTKDRITPPTYPRAPGVPRQSPL